ncbi:hypothetical protein PanWU01x14_193440, partial [Parasponia andersonii]
MAARAFQSSPPPTWTAVATAISTGLESFPQEDQRDENGEWRMECLVLSLVIQWLTGHAFSLVTTRLCFIITIVIFFVFFIP